MPIPAEALKSLIAALTTLVALLGSYQSPSDGKPDTPTTPIAVPGCPTATPTPPAESDASTPETQGPTETQGPAGTPNNAETAGSDTPPVGQPTTLPAALTTRAEPVEPTEAPGEEEPTEDPGESDEPGQIAPGEPDPNGTPTPTNPVPAPAPDPENCPTDDPTEQPTTPPTTPAPNDPTTPPTEPTPTMPPTAGSGTTAAAKFGWKNPVTSIDFDGAALPAGVEAMGDYAGHAGQGQRLKKQVKVSGGVAKITGDKNGNTTGIGIGPNQKYGRWEARTRLSAGATDYHGVLLLWPENGGGNVESSDGSEVDFSEAMDPTRKTVSGFVHARGMNQLSAQVTVDATKWHNWAMEWTPEKITYYVDGKEWFSTTDKKALPAGPMSMTAQLDYFPGDQGATAEATMEIDWVRVYKV